MKFQGDQLDAKNDRVRYKAIKNQLHCDQFY